MVLLLFFCGCLFISYHITPSECLMGSAFIFSVDCCMNVVRNVIFCVFKSNMYTQKEMKLEECNSSTSRYLEHSHCSHFSALPFCICLLLLFFLNLLHSSASLFLCYHLGCYKSSVLLLLVLTSVQVWAYVTVESLFC